MPSTIITLTVDTEFSNHKDDLGVFGRVGGKDCGLEFMADLLNRYGIKSTFFVDVYTDRREYIPRFTDACLSLKRQGHDLELHTHPEGLFDQKKGSMKDYSIQAQIDIVRKGKVIFQEWFGDGPVAHRAGDWGADENTLRALKENGIFVDCSYFHLWRNCRLNKIMRSQNAPLEVSGVLELPPSVYRTTSLGVFHPLRLLSTDGNLYPETIQVLKMLQQNQVRLILWVKENSREGLFQIGLRVCSLLREILRLRLRGQILQCQVLAVLLLSQRY